MASRGRPVAAGMMRHGPPPGTGVIAGHRSGDPPEFVAQVAEIDRLLLENRKLATSIRAMRQDFTAAQEEIQKLKLHIKSTETESDIQIRVLLEKIAKMELGLQAGDSVKNDLQQAHEEAQNLVVARKELILKIQQASQELERYHTDIKNVPDMISELDSVRVEHQRLRSAFEHEKRINADLVERLQNMEKNLVGMSREVEILRAEVLNGDKNVQGPYAGAYSNSDPQRPSLSQGNGPYYDPYLRPHMPVAGSGAMEGMVPHGNANGPHPAVGVIPNPSVSGAVAPLAWTGAYDPNIGWK